MPFNQRRFIQEAGSDWQPPNDADLQAQNAARLTRQGKQDVQTGYSSQSVSSEDSSGNVEDLTAEAHSERAAQTDL